MIRRKRMDDVIAFVLAGGAGERLMPLTAGRAKPAVPFGGKWFIIDPALYSLYHSGLNTIKVLTQSSSQPLIQHVARCWPRRPNGDDYIEVVPAQQQTGKDWYTGTANAVFQNLDILAQNPDFELIAISAGDHIFKFDMSQMREFHDHKKADFTICGVELPVHEVAGRFGVIVVDENSRVIDFQEKPMSPAEIPGKPGLCYASMGNYITHVKIIREVLTEDANNPASLHDFGKDVIPMMVHGGLGVYVYNFAENKVPDQKKPYWVDVGAIGPYHQANIDLAGKDPELNLYSQEWPIMTPPDKEPPGKHARKSSVEYSLLSGGDILDGASVSHSVFGRRVTASFGSKIEQCILFDRVIVGEGAEVFRTIVCEDISIPPHAKIGLSDKDDRKMGIFIDRDSGIRVIPRGFIFSR
ncbi:MAG: sugar phosphate nucleotidyltransferase [Candidatus Azambacteria bacterium]|nr:sugar phosphate nucleotidyltransferase [Candidatus Azambacteria bacterium]